MVQEKYTRKDIEQLVLNIVGGYFVNSYTIDTPSVEQMKLLMEIANLVKEKE